LFSINLAFEIILVSLSNIIRSEQNTLSQMFVRRLIFVLPRHFFAHHLTLKLNPAWAKTGRENFFNSNEI